MPGPMIRVPAEVDEILAVHRPKVHQRVARKLVHERLNLSEAKRRFVINRFSGGAKRYPPVVLEHFRSVEASLIFVIECAVVGWDECLTELLVQLGDHGLVAVVKIDGERRRSRWTVLVSGKPLGGELVRWDGDDLNAGLSQVIARLRKHVPGLLD